MQKVTREQLLPPACSVISRTDKDEWFIDLGWFEDYYGTVYIGKMDFDEMAKCVDYEPSANLQKYKDRIKELQNDLRNITAERDSLVALRDAVFATAEPSNTNNSAA